MNQPNLKSKVLSLSELADYQAGSIVSRMIIDKKAGSITLFAFDKGQGLSEHTVPFDAFAFIIDGETEIVRNRFVKDADVKDIKISTESMTNEDGRTSNVSSIEIYLVTRIK